MKKITICSLLAVLVVISATDKASAGFVAELTVQPYLGVWYAPVLNTTWDNLNSVTLTVNAYESSVQRGDRLYYYDNDSPLGPDWYWSGYVGTLYGHDLFYPYTFNLMAFQSTLGDELLGEGLRLTQGVRDTAAVIFSMTLTVDSKTEINPTGQSIPEPATMLLLGLGGVLIRKQKVIHKKVL